MHESELLHHIYRRSSDLPQRFPQIITGPGHDCAVVALGRERALLKVDQLVAGRHFLDGTPIDLIARKAMARAVSDIAAAGGTPVAALAGVVLPTGYGEANELFDAMARWAAHFACPLAGGDIASAPGPLMLSVSVVGRPHAKRGPVLRSGAIPGDGVYVTGTLGGSLESGGRGRHLTFEPRLREAAFLCDALGERLHAMMDLSDGLGRDSGRLARASGVAIVVEQALLPLSPGITDWSRALGDGEDYELFFAAAGDVPRMCPETGTPITRVGSVEKGSGSTIKLRDKSRMDVSEMGWEY